VLGAKGGTLALANVFPNQCAEVQEYYEAGDLEAARNLQLSAASFVAFRPGRTRGVTEYPGSHWVCKRRGNMLGVYKLPTELFFGCGASKHTGEKLKELGARKVFLVCDPGIKQAGLLEGIIASIKEAGLEYVVYDGIKPEPTSDIIEEGTEVLRKSGCDVVLGVGGGSALDCAKAFAAMVTNEGQITDYTGVGKLRNKPLPIVAIPTTAGTGSEATMFTVITDAKTKLKAPVGSYMLMPVLAILDPELTVGLPPHLTASTGMDALTHAIESYVNVNSHPISEALAIHSIKLIARSLRKAVAKGTNLKAREDMLLASTIAALAFNSTRLGLVHAMSQPAGAHFGIPHGLSNAILLPYVMEYNLMGNPEKYAEIAALFGEQIEGLPIMEAAAKSVKAVRELMQDIGIRERLSDFGVKESDLDMLADEALTSGNVPLNPRQPSKEDIIEIYKKAL